MPIGTIIEDHRTREQASAITAHVRASGPVLPDGARLAVGGPTSDGWRMTTVWDSLEARDAFYRDRLGPAFAAAGISLDDAKRTEFEVDVLLAADLTGAR
jgi:hypothetical protein